MKTEHTVGLGLKLTYVGKWLSRNILAAGQRFPWTASQSAVYEPIGVYGGVPVSIGKPSFWNKNSTQKI